MKKKKNNQSQIIIYKAEDGQIKIDVRFDGDTVWLTQSALAELFQTTKQNISQHIKNVFDEGELMQNATVKYFLTVQSEGSREVSRDQNKEPGAFMLHLLHGHPILPIRYNPL